MPWLALSVQVPPAGAEALSDALIEAGAQAAAIEDVEAELHTVNALLDLSSDPATLLAAAARQCGVPTPSFSIERIPDDDWVVRTQSQFQPAEIGARLWVGPTWHEPPRGKAAVVRLDPGLAFGTGAHPSTRLVLAFLESEIHGGERVLDYGCGSGILAIAAAKLGARLVDAADIDPQAVEVTRKNAQRNAVDLHAVALADSLPTGIYDVVVANILAQPLIVLAPMLASCTASGGRIALSGILETQAEEVARAYAPWFDAGIHARDEAWALVTGKRQ